MTRLSYIPQQFIKCGHDQRDDLDQWVVVGIHLAPDSSAGVGRAYVINADNTLDRELSWSNTADKDDSISVKVLRSGDVRIVWCQAAPGGGGVTSQPEAVIIPGVFAPRGEYMPARDQPARDQAVSCQHVANTAFTNTQNLNTRTAEMGKEIDALTARMDAIEGV
jgi:hypothetical protein